MSGGLKINKTAVLLVNQKGLILANSTHKRNLVRLLVLFVCSAVIIEQILKPTSLPEV